MYTKYMLSLEGKYKIMEILLPEVFNLIIGQLVNTDLPSCFFLARSSKGMKSMVYKLIVRRIENKKLTITYKDVIIASGEVRGKHNIPRYIDANYMIIQNGKPAETLIRCKYNRSGTMINKHQLIPSSLIAIYSKPHRNRKTIYRAGVLIKSVNDNNGVTIKYYKRINVFSVCVRLGLNVGLEGTNETAFRIVTSVPANNNILSVHTGLYWKTVISW